MTLDPDLHTMDNANQYAGDSYDWSDDSQSSTRSDQTDLVSEEYYENREADITPALQVCFHPSVAKHADPSSSEVYLSTS